MVADVFYLYDRNKMHNAHMVADIFYLYNRYKTWSPTFSTVFVLLYDRKQSHICECFISRGRIVLWFNEYMNIYIYIYCLPFQPKLHGFESQFFSSKLSSYVHRRQLGSGSLRPAACVRIFFGRIKGREVGAIPRSFLFLCLSTHTCTPRDSPAKQAILYWKRGSLLMTLSSLCRFYVVSSNRS